MSQSGSVLCIGLCCLDLVAKANSFPMEDTDHRIPSIDWQLGGNAAHNALVLSALESTTVYFAGTLPSSGSMNERFFAEVFSKHSVDMCLCEFTSGPECPISMVVINTTNGSRTILHCRRNFPEFSFDNFLRQDLVISHLSWIHFEGRYNVAEIASVLAQVKLLNQNSNDKRIFTSVELEKCEPEFTRLLCNTDVVIMSKEFAQFHKASNKVAAVEHFRSKLDLGATVICAWGSLGCAGAVNSVNADEAGSISVDAVAPAAVVDTLGAGDTFISGCIHGFRRGWRLLRVLQFAAALAGEKCSRSDGFDRVTEWAPEVAVRYAAAGSDYRQIAQRTEYRADESKV